MIYCSWRQNKFRNYTWIVVKADANEVCACCISFSRRKTHEFVARKEITKYAVFFDWKVFEKTLIDFFYELSMSHAINTYLQFSEALGTWSGQDFNLKMMNTECNKSINMFAISKAYRKQIIIQWGISNVRKISWRK